MARIQSGQRGVMKVRTFVALLPLYLELDIAHWLRVCPVSVIRIHYQDNGQLCSALVEYDDM